MKLQKCFKKVLCFLLTTAMLFGTKPITANVVKAEEFPTAADAANPDKNLAYAAYLEALALFPGLAENGRVDAGLSKSSTNSNDKNSSANAFRGSRTTDKSWTTGSKEHSTYGSYPLKVGVAINLGSPKSFNTIAIYSKNQARINSMVIEYSNDGTAWEELSNNNTAGSWDSLSSEKWTTFSTKTDFDSSAGTGSYNITFAVPEVVTAQYVRLVQEISDANTNSVPIYSFEIYNNSDSAPALPSPFLIPATGTYIKGSGLELTTRITPNGNTFSHIITEQSTVLVIDSDYTFDINADGTQSVNLTNNFLESLQQGVTNLTFHFDNNFTKSYSINVTAPEYADIYLNNPGFGHAIITPDYTGMSLTIGRPAVIDVTKTSDKFPVFNVTKAATGTAITGNLYAPDGSSVHTFPVTTIEDGTAVLTIPDTIDLIKGTYKASFELVYGESKLYDNYYFTAIDNFNTYFSTKNEQNSNNANVANVSPDDWEFSAYPAIQLENGKLIYIPDYKGNQVMDNSLVGYQGGGVALPNVPVLVKLQPLEDNQQDATEMIQEAIDYISRYPLSDEGYRGTLYLDEGVYRISKPLIISASGVVIRGAGQGTMSPLIGDGSAENPYTSQKANQEPEPGVTKLISTWKVNPSSTWVPPDSQSTITGSPYSTAQNSTLIYFDGQGLTMSDVTANVTDQYVGAGQFSIHVDSIAGLSVGDLVVVQKAINADWAKAMYMDKVDGASNWLDNNDRTKLASGFNGVPFVSERTIKSINVETKEITFHEPLSDNLDMRWGVSKIVKVKEDGRLTNVGVENIQGISHFYDEKAVPVLRWGVNFISYNDENHAQVFIQMNNVRDSWVRNFTTYQIDRAFATDGASRNITVQDGYVLDPVSLITGGERRYSIYYKNAEFMFTQRIYSRYSRHAFVVDSYNSGPNVFYDSKSEYLTNGSEPHFRWSSAGLYDNVSARIYLQNRWDWGTSHGHAGVNYMIYNCDGPFLATQPQITPNYVIGHSYDPATSNTMGVVNGDNVLGRINNERDASANMAAAYLNGGKVPNFKAYEYSIDDKVTPELDNMPVSLYIQQLIDKKGSDAAKVLEDNQVPEMIDHAIGERPHLTGLYVDGTLVEGFSPDKYNYTIHMPLDYDYSKKPEITATADEGMSIKIEDTIRNGIEYKDITLTDAHGIMSFYVVTFDIINKSPILVATSQQVDASNSNYAMNVLQSDYASGLRWAASGPNWIRMYLGETAKSIDGITIGFYPHASSNRTYIIRLEYSTDGRNWITVSSGTMTSETTSEPTSWSATDDTFFHVLTTSPSNAAEKKNHLQTFTFDVPVTANFIRVSTNGNITGSGANVWGVFTYMRPVFSDDSIYTTPTGVTVTGENTVKLGESIQLSTEVTPNEATIKEVLWSSSDTSVATVSSKGKVTGLAPGKATITATTVDGIFIAPGTIQYHTATVEVTVYTDTTTPEDPGDNTPITPTPTPPSTNEGSVDKTYEQEKGAPTVRIDNIIAELISMIFTKEEQDQIAAGESSKIILKVQDISNSIKKKEKKLIREKLSLKNKDLKNVLFIDLSLYKQVGNSEQTKVTETNGKIRISLKVPKRFRNTPAAKNRTFYVLRVHGQEVTRIEGSYDPITFLFTFETDRFSTYALSYQDTAKKATTQNFHDLQLKVKAGKTSQTLSYKKVKDADGYLIYGAARGQEMEKLADVLADVTSYKVKDLKKSSYKYQVKAYQLIDGEQVIIRTSKVAHSITETKAYTNPTKVALDVANINLAIGEWKTITGQIAQPKGKKLKSHTTNIRYESSNKEVVTVNKKGKITAKEKGTSYIYAYAPNGVYSKIKVTVN